MFLRVAALAAKHVTEHAEAISLLKSASEKQTAELAKAAESVHSAKLEVQQLLSLIPSQQQLSLQPSVPTSVPAAQTHALVPIDPRVAMLEQTRLDLELERKQVIFFTFIFAVTV
jgi:hypothetical protein